MGEALDPLWLCHVPSIRCVHLCLYLNVVCIAMQAFIGHAVVRLCLELSCEESQVRQSVADLPTASLCRAVFVYTEHPAANG